MKETFSLEKAKTKYKKVENFFCRFSLDQTLSKNLPFHFSLFPSAQYNTSIAVNIPHSNKKKVEIVENDKLEACKKVREVVNFFVCCKCMHTQLPAEFTPHLTYP